jgi:hypothetical protein
MNPEQAVFAILAKKNGWYSRKRRPGSKESISLDTEPF